jgi:dipeptidase E
MRTLLLMSSGSFFTGQASKIVPEIFQNINIAHVITASKGVTDLSYLERHRQNMTELGWKFEEIDLDGKNEQQLRQLFKDKNIIYVEGGNAFYLLKSVRESGFDKVVKDLINQGVVYAGSSAGAYLACPTIEMSAWKKKHHDYGVTDLTALHLVPFLLFAHYSSEFEEMLKQKISQTSYPVRVLTNDQAILVQDDKVKFVGQGKEIKIN